ncbi:MAG: nitrogenase cofactor biosynthesis protein NifB [Candidatus Methanomethylophilaceae archaeon]|nr:nitrogenase cofactor biosynthesis protein NifB [Candidatus Methanomethylophilaceae archaeon]
MREEVIESLRSHPCYNEEAHKRFARMHLPVAPRCNIQCNYCNRKYDCSNESRPGVTSEVLSPQEAIEKIRVVKERIPELKVIAIAGPGDPLANEQSFETMELVHKEFPDMTLCISTNGLMLPEYADRLFEIGIRFVTVTMNACDPEVSKDIYSMVMWDGKKLTGKEAAERLLQSQIEGIKRCVELGMAVKINIVLIPGYNDKHIPDLVKKVKELGVYIVNILPLIPVEGTPFSVLEAPTPELRKELMNLCENDVKMMRHCRQCRADAIGLLDNDRSGEFIRTNPCGSGCGPKTEPNVRFDLPEKVSKVAVATESGTLVDGGFGNTKRFKIFDIRDNKVSFVKDVYIDTDFTLFGKSHAEHIAGILDSLSDCDAVIVSEIGPRPQSALEAAGKRVVVFSGDIEEGIRRASSL